ncbi:MAG: lantibiotic dehydratase [Ktedonobacteraceae bacterium]|nr:lantibiotic dehydratase family protein [Chloroflexota bacterium]
MTQQRESLRDGWSLSPYTLVRTTGFPFELVERLNCSKTAAMLDTPLEEQALQETYAAEFASLLSRLHEASIRPDFQEALFLSSPSAFAGLHVPAPGSPIRSKERKLLRHLLLYLQRVTTKCDTNSFFGPTWWGRAGQGQELIAFSAPARFAIARRCVLWTHWAVTAIAEVIAADPQVQAHLALWPAHGLALSGEQAWLTDFSATPPETQGPIALNDVEQHLLTQCLAPGARLRREELMEETTTRRAALDSLITRGLLRSAIEIPSGLEQPLDWLVASLQSFPEPVKQHWLPLLAELEASRVRYQDGDLEQRQREKVHMSSLFESACQRDATRGEGTFYSDRSLLCEEARRDWQRCDLGEPLLTDIAREILPVTYTLLDIQCRRQRLRQAAASAWFATAFSDETDVSLPRMLAAAEGDEALETALAGAEESVVPASAELALWLCQGGPSRRRVEISPQVMQDRAASIDLLPCVVNPDLMIGARSIEAANNGDYYLVLGEEHTMQDLTVRTSASAFHHEKEEAVMASARQYARILPGVTVAEPVLEHTDKTKVLLPHPLLQIEFAGRALDPLSSAANAVPGILRAGDLRVRCQGETLSLLAPGIDAIVLTRTPVWSPFNRTSILNIFALPHCNRFEGQIYSYPPGCTHFPRVTSGRLVIHRETWWMDPQPAWKKVSGYSLNIWRQLRAWRAEQQVPEQVFVRFRDEPKPVFMDFRNSLLIDWFMRKIATTEHPACISEFLPEATDLWLRDAGGRYCCEFRMTMYLDGGYPAA